MRRTAIGLAVVAIVVLGAAAALAGERVPIENTTRMDVELIPTPAGDAIHAKGRAMSSGTKMVNFGVAIWADVPDGTTFLVTVDSFEKKYAVGTITTFLGGGSLRVQWDPELEALPRALDIHEVWVADVDGKDVLAGKMHSPEKPIRLMPSKFGGR